MLQACQITVLLLFLVNRALTLSLPLFRSWVAQHFWPNLACGLASDLSFALGIMAVMELARLMDRRPRLATVVRGVAVLSVVGVTVSFAVHIRYVEHFGMTIRPFHLQEMMVPEMWSVGPSMVFVSWRPVVLLLLPCVLVTARWMSLPAIPPSPAQVVLRALPLLVLAALLNSAMLHLRAWDSVHSELRYNPFAALFWNTQAHRNAKWVPAPGVEERAGVRRLFPGSRFWAEGEAGREHPLLQRRVPGSEGVVGPPEDEDARLGRALTQHLADGRNQGPWNVVVVLLESLRARELESFGNTDPATAPLTPNLTRIFGTGVKFTSTLHASMHTAHAQLAALCSSLAFVNYSLMLDAPLTPLVCLADIFKARGYGTHFFYPADNHFDLQDSFHAFHSMDTLVGKADFPADAPTGGWGFSDAALYRLTLERLTAARQPFFATVLTLSNHGPNLRPTDTPASIPRDIAATSQLLRYVDWSFAAFYQELAQRFPHTVVVVVADHGLNWGIELSESEATAQTVWDVARIPWVLLIPGLPAPLAGSEVKRLVSNVDVPPTLLRLLGETEHAQAFMGTDAFTRAEPVYINWYERLWRWEDTAGEVPGTRTRGALMRVDPNLEALLGALARYHLLMPAPDVPEAARDSLR